MQQKSGEPAFWFARIGGMTPVDRMPPDIEDDADLVADVFDRACPSREALHAATSRWGVLALAALHDGELRFSELRRRVDGVSERMLSQTLQSLERDGFVDREVLQQIPPRVEYSLTELGREVAKRLVGLIELVEGRMAEVVAAQEDFRLRQ